MERHGKDSPDMMEAWVGPEAYRCVALLRGTRSTMTSMTGEPVLAPTELPAGSPC
jgi:hypothetical protein